VNEREQIESELKALIIETLVLEDLTPEQIGSDDALFGGGLDLDSIDALEIGLALEKRYGIEIGDDGDANQQRFASIRNLAAFVAEARGAGA